VQVLIDPPPTGSPSVTRFSLIDGLRGGASLGVALFHFWKNPAFAVAREATPPALRKILGGGRLGVEVFFVISGFVMAYTLRNAVVTPRYAGAFILRRSLRLDPPYWLTLALALLAAKVSDVLVHRPISTTPELPVILAHLVYLQELLGYPHILLTFWTLCLEVQFYLLLLAFVWLSARVSRGTYGVLHGLLALLSLATYCRLIPALPGLFLSYWFMFLVGCTVAWTSVGRLPLWVPSCMAAGCVIVGLVLWNPEPVIAGLAAGIVTAGVWRPYLMATLRAKPIQWLGRISYSLYLVHPLIGERLQNVGRRIHGDHVGWAWAWLVLAAVGTLAVAAAFHRGVEAPSLALARHLTDPWLKRAAGRPTIRGGTAA
jgi:peptidoglycan/LPS O-acetylase OafA/YrhL